MRDEIRIDRTKFSITTLEEADGEDVAFWHGKTPSERLAAMELTRQLIYGYDPTTARLQRVLEVAERS